ncbi:hypothetical protein [Natrinema salsiterrestre]|uniref:DUF1467 domain-containing protein n=1 Tax=Natrinema salsiterrestre TaxID=2950540 RepID=A0A9Q4L3X5_9EURY|nr:hypothetical protein [Natrinema salsiterrestre]MDF9746413.1 hypothetical protein [Natrinema salsiterrestre]
MPRSGPNHSVPVLAGSVAIVATGVAVNTGLDTSARTVPALLLIALGVAGVTSTARESSTVRLRRGAKRWWLLAFAAFLPYALATAPDSESAAAVGDAFAGPVVGLALESIAGAMVCCAVAMTVLYAFAWYGIHPGRPTPEERVLTDGGDE